MAHKVQALDDFAELPYLSEAFEATIEADAMDDLLWDIRSIHFQQNKYILKCIKRFLLSLNGDNRRSLDGKIHFVGATKIDEVKDDVFVGEGTTIKRWGRVWTLVNGLTDPALLHFISQYSFLFAKERVPVTIAAVDNFAEMDGRLPEVTDPRDFFSLSSKPQTKKVYERNLYVQREHCFRKLFYGRRNLDHQERQKRKQTLRQAELYLVLTPKIGLSLMSGDLIIFGLHPLFPSLTPSSIVQGCNFRLVGYLSIEVHPTVRFATRLHFHWCNRFEMPSLSYVVTNSSRAVHRIAELPSCVRNVIAEYASIELMSMVRLESYVGTKGDIHRGEANIQIGMNVHLSVEGFRGHMNYFSLKRGFNERVQWALHGFFHPPKMLQFNLEDIFVLKKKLAAHGQRDLRPCLGLQEPREIVPTYNIYNFAL